MKSKDSLGDRMKAFEAVENERFGEKGMPICARLDGRAFSTFTDGLGRPFDRRMTNLMVATTKYLVEETGAVVGYTQSDEISLMWYLPESSCSQYLFGGRYQKIATTCAALGTGFFNRNLDDALPERAGQIPTFDCRVWTVPTLEDAYDTFLWREKDAIKNSISMAAQAHFEPKDLHKVNSSDKLEMLRSVGYPWEMMPPSFQHGTYLRRVKVLKELSPEVMASIPEAHRPSGPVERSEVQKVDVMLDLWYHDGSHKERDLKLLFPSLFE